MGFYRTPDVSSLSYFIDRKNGCINNFHFSKNDRYKEKKSIEIPLYKTRVESNFLQHLTNPPQRKIEVKSYDL